jgi:hypothetical protein
VLVAIILPQYLAGLVLAQTIHIFEGQNTEVLFWRVSEGAVCCWQLVDKVPFGQNWRECAK